MQRSISFFCTDRATPKISIIWDSPNQRWVLNEWLTQMFFWIKKWGKTRVFGWNFVIYIIEPFFPTAHFAQGDRSSYVNHFSKWLLKAVIRKLVRLHARWRFLGIVSVQIIPGCSWQTCIVMVKNIFRSLQFWFRKSQIKHLCLAHSAEISYFDLQFWIYFARQVNYTYIMCTVLTVEEARSNFFLGKDSAGGDRDFQST